MAYQCTKCSKSKIVLAKRYIVNFDVDDDDIDELDLDRYEEIITDPVWVMVHFCMECEEIQTAWIEEVEGAGAVEENGRLERLESAWEKAVNLYPNLEPLLESSATQT